MPKGPQGQKRPADVIGRAVHVAKIATGEISESGYAQPNKRQGRVGGCEGARGDDQPGEAQRNCTRGCRN